MQDQRNGGLGYPGFAGPEIEAWTLVLGAIEEAVDVDGLSSWDRGRLAGLHAHAAWHIGVAAPTVPPPPPPPPDPLYRMLDVIPEVARLPLTRAGICDLDTLRRLAEEGGLTSVSGIGPRIERRILDALAVAA